MASWRQHSERREWTWVFLLLLILLFWLWLGLGWRYFPPDEQNHPTAVHEAPAYVKVAAPPLH